ncbi:MAG: hypothetical protein AB1744_03050, partial [Candidatus Zixiibacteriota bacterium]
AGDTVTAQTGGTTAADETAAQAGAAAEETSPTVSISESGGSSEEILHTGVLAKKTKIHREYARLSGIGGIFALGSVGSYLFSSGFILILTSVFLILYTLACIGLPVYMLYGVFGARGDADERALKLKKILRLNWLPLILFVVTLIIAFVGADYGFNPDSLFDSIGTGYGIGAFANTLSWGVFLSLCGFLLAAVKGIEI